MDFLTDTMATKVKLLIADDSQIIGRRLRNLLSELEFIKLAGLAENYNEVLLFTGIMKPHVLVLDINIDGKRGLELLKKIKEDYPSVKVIVLTNRSDMQYQKLCIKLGADYFLNNLNCSESLPRILQQVHETMGDHEF